MTKSKFRKRMRRYSPRRRYRSFRTGKSPLPILPLLGGVVAPLAGAFDSAGGMSALQNNPTELLIGMVDQICQRYMGYSALATHWGRKPEFNIMWMLPTYMGLGAGLAGHTLANKLGVNKAMKKIPLAGKWVQL